jgi:GNAT superfamily N-acetyltransferase
MSTQPTTRRHIYAARTSSDVQAATAIIAEAFTALAACEWLVPDRERRRDVLAGVFEILVLHALDHGHIDLLTQAPADGEAARTGEGCTGEGAGIGAAVWFHHDHPIPPPPDYDERLRQAAGEHTERFQVLDEMFDAHHPHALAHHHLAFLAVLPAHQGTLIGSALLTHHQGRLSAEGMPAYLESSTPDSRRLYSTHGYRDCDQPFALPNGAPFYPMWRVASPAAGSGAGTQS